MDRLAGRARLPGLHREQERAGPVRVLARGREGALQPFVEATMATELSRGVGLPGRVMASGRPAWIADVARDPTSRAGRSAERWDCTVPWPSPCRWTGTATPSSSATPSSRWHPTPPARGRGHIGRQLGRLIQPWRPRRRCGSRNPLPLGRRIRQRRNHRRRQRRRLIVSWNRGAALMFGYTQARSWAAVVDAHAGAVPGHARHRASSASSRAAWPRLA